MASSNKGPDPNDPHAWLEDVLGEKPLAWVKERNDECIKACGDPTALSTYKRILAVYDSKDKIPSLQRIGNDGWYYNFWRDDVHVQGIWRRCTLESYRAGGDSVKWQTVIDVDALPPPSSGTAATWVWHGHSPLDEGLDSKWDRTLVSLSPGGSDADVMREFDLTSGSWVSDLAKDESSGIGPAFELLSAAKTDAGYRSRRELLVGTDFGLDGSCLTDSGYPRVVKSWLRGTPLEEAVVVFEGEQSDVAANQYAYFDRFGAVHEFQCRAITFYTSKYWHRTPTDLASVSAVEDPTPFKEVPVPDDVASLTTFGHALMFTLRSPWAPPGAPLYTDPEGREQAEYPAGCLLAAPMAAAMDNDWSQLTALFVPTAAASLEAQAATKNYLVLKVLDNVNPTLRFWRYEPSDSSWTDTTAATAEQEGSGAPVSVGEDVSVVAVWPDDSDEVWLWRDGYLQPSTLALADASKGCAAPLQLRQLPSMFDASALEVTQHFAISADGTRVPFMVQKRRGLAADNSHPTLLDAYGGFEISLLPGYSAGTGVGWLERGGVKVVANIRGGGEYGPKWHQAALQARRHKAYEDLEAVGRALIEDLKLTCPAKLACIGGSNGGLLVGNMLTRPSAAQLFGAAVCQVPLLDMKRFSHLLAGASWMAEYGDPDVPDQWCYLRRHSPYHLLRHDNLQIEEAAPALPPPDSYLQSAAPTTTTTTTTAATSASADAAPALSSANNGWVCPKVLFTTSTRDDRVHPAHARKMVAALLGEAQPMGAAPEVLYWENTEGGHGGAADNKQRAYMWALSFEFLAKALGLPPSPPASS